MYQISTCSNKLIKFYIIYYFRITHSSFKARRDNKDGDAINHLHTQANKKYLIEKNREKV